MSWIAFCLSDACTIEGSDHDYEVCLFAVEIVAMLIDKFRWAAWESDGDNLNLADLGKGGADINLTEYSSFINSFT